MDFDPRDYDSRDDERSTPDRGRDKDDYSNHDHADERDGRGAQKRTGGELE